MKRPSFQFYPSDWLRDTALQTCSIAARGLWIDMICYMHQGTPYGHLKVNLKVILPANLARMVGATLDEITPLLDELRLSGVFDTTQDGVIYSKRMVKDESIRESRASGGKLGGNPALIHKKVNLPDNLTVNNDVNFEVEKKDKQKPTPSSSSSSSSSSSFSISASISKEEKTCPAKPDGGVQKVFDHWRTAMRHPHAKLDAKREKAVKQRLRDGYTPDDICLAVDGCLKSAFHQGQNQNGSKYDDIELICRSATNIDKFILLASEPDLTALSTAGRSTAKVALEWLGENHA